MLCYWATPAPMDSQQDSKPHSASKGSREDFFFFFMFTKNIFIYFSSLFSSFIYLFRAVPAPLALPLESCSMTPTHTPSPLSLFFFSPLRLSFNTTAVENQTALKQIDVLFNIVVTSSQGPHASALVTTAGLLSLAGDGCHFVGRFNDLSQKREGDCESGKREREGGEKNRGVRQKRKVPWIMIESVAPLIDKV